MVHTVIQEVTQRIADRSRESRHDYEARMQAAAGEGTHRKELSCGNLAHGFAAMGEDKPDLRHFVKPNIAIVSAYNDMLSAHQPYKTYPDLIKLAAREAGGVAQFAGGVPAMCDGVTQGQPGMELSLFSRDVIAQATAVALSHNMFDAALCLGICDKIVPGLVMGSLAFGHLPIIFVPGGPMPSGLPNKEKQRIRQLYAEGKATREELLDAEAQSYHSAGTCTFYGTANSNQMLMEIMGLQLPGSSFVNPNTPLRNALTQEATRRALAITAQKGKEHIPLWQVYDVRSVVNGIIGLHATGGSTNHTIHLIAMARAAGIIINWDDFADLSKIIPLMCRIYPNGQADVNHFHAAGGMGFLIGSLLDHGLLHENVVTIAGHGLNRYRQEPKLIDGRLQWQDGAGRSLDLDVLRPADDAFSMTGGLSLLEGNLGRAVMKTSAVQNAHRTIRAPAKIFRDQNEIIDAHRKGELECDFVAVVLFQGPKANGMPELHKLTPPLGVLQDKGYKVALVTDGRMSGASGKVPAAIHVSPECMAGGEIGKIRDGDIITVDAEKGILQAEVDPAEWARREILTDDLERYRHGMGREVFAGVRSIVSTAEEGASFVL